MFNPATSRGWLDDEARRTGFGLLVMICSFHAAAVHAACSDYAPTSGQTVICDTSPPKPDTTAVIAADGSQDVTVRIQAGSELNTVGPSASVGDRSEVVNHGSVTALGTAAIMGGTGARVVNHGTLVNTQTEKQDNAWGIYADHSDSYVENTGTVTLVVNLRAYNYQTGIQGSVVRNSGIVIVRGGNTDGSYGMDGSDIVNTGTVTVEQLGGRVSGLLCIRDLVHASAKRKQA